MHHYQIHPYNEHSLLVEFTGLALPEAHQRVQWLYEYSMQHLNNLLADRVPAYHSLLLIANDTESNALVQVAITEHLEKDVNATAISGSRTITIPVCYDPALGNDLESMAACHHQPSDRIIEIHAQGMYKVYMLGFLPGFAYMGEVSEQIATPRKPTPVATRAGAVGIAGRQTGIYPVDSPGGWNIVGYTPLKIFDVTKEDPALLKPGDTVRFEPIDLITYNHMQENGGS